MHRGHLTHKPTTVGVLQSGLPKNKNTWDDQQWDDSSPTGVPYAEGLPEEVNKPDRKHIDSKEVYGKTMLRKVAPTSSAPKYRLAGRDVSDLRLTDLLWR